MGKNRQQVPAAEASGRAAVRKARDIQIGGVYKVSIRGRWTEVRVLSRAPEGKKGWIILNSRTGRTVHIRWAYLLQSDAELATREVEGLRFAAEMRRASDELRQGVAAKRRARAAKSRGMSRRDVEDEEELQRVAGEHEIYREICTLEGGEGLIDLQGEH
jgi:hypothetical protein